MPTLAQVYGKYPIARDDVNAGVDEYGAATILYQAVPSTADSVEAPWYSVTVTFFSSGSIDFFWVFEDEGAASAATFLTGAITLSAQYPDGTGVSVDIDVCGGGSCATAISHELYFRLHAAAGPVPGSLLAPGTHVQMRGATHE
jgi:hypothetical protein